VKFRSQLAPWLSVGRGPLSHAHAKAVDRLPSQRSRDQSFELPGGLTPAELPRRLEQRAEEIQNGNRQRAYEAKRARLLRPKSRSCRRNSRRRSRPCRKHEKKFDGACDFSHRPFAGGREASGGRPRRELDCNGVLHDVGCAHGSFRGDLS
jgi:hypothetical protein